MLISCVLLYSIMTGENDDELYRLLQLVLGCAVRCERQEEFIQAILQMEKDVQFGIMAAIGVLPGIELSGGSLADMPGRSPSQTEAMKYRKLLAQLEAVNEDKEKLVLEQSRQVRIILLASCLICRISAFWFRYPRYKKKFSVSSRSLIRRL